MWLILLLICAQSEDLVRRLGSDKPAEREAAEAALLDLGEEARKPLEKAAQGADVEIVARARALLLQLDEEALLDRLVGDYRKYGLPFPPPESKPVLHSAWLTEQFGFLVGPGKAPKTIRLFQGTREEEVEEARAKSKPFALTDPLPEALDLQVSEPFPLNAGLAAAIQCRARGWKRLSRVLLARSLKEKIGDDRTPFFQPAELSTKSAFAFLAWAWLGNELARPGSDRAALARSMKELFASEPKLDREPVRFLMKSVEATIAPRAAAKGSVEALIDDWVDLKVDLLGLREQGSDPRYLKVVELGFDAVPTLIDRLNDIRLTRSVSSGFSFGHQDYRRVGDFAFTLLYGLVANLGAEDWFTRAEDGTVDVTPFSAWWKAASAEGEEKYLKDHALPSREVVVTVWYDEAVRVLAKKHPRSLATLYIRSWTHPQGGRWPLAERVAQSLLPKEEKVKLLDGGARQKGWSLRQSAIAELQGLDADCFHARLLEALAELPARPEGATAYCRESYVGTLALLTDDARVWEALGAAFRRAEPALRIEMIAHLDGDDLSAGRRTRLHRFLAGFLDDEARRGKSEEKGLYGEGYGTIEVRNAAALRLAELLELPGIPEALDTAEAWIALRARVKEALPR